MAISHKFLFVQAKTSWNSKEWEVMPASTFLNYLINNKTSNSCQDFTRTKCTGTPPLQNEKKNPFKIYFKSLKICLKLNSCF